MRILIVSPHFPPVNSPDMQRVRSLLPYLADVGIDAEVLAVEPEQVAAPRDTWLSDGLPENVPVHRVCAHGLKWGKIPGLGTLGLRCLGALKKRGGELLASGNFDLVYFSTTVFEVHILGSHWKKKHRVPFVMDYQDPWVNDYYRDHPNVVPPGGRVKYAVIDAIHRRMEPRALRHCSGITTVSPSYPEQLAKRYQWFNVRRHKETGQVNAGHVIPFEVLPFPWSKHDINRAQQQKVRQSVFDPADGCIHWVYTGVLVPGMLLAVGALFAAISRYAPKSLLDKLRLHFVGTSYALEGCATSKIEQLAAGAGLKENVTERVSRVPYSEVLACLCDADALMAFGSDDASYTPSKIQPYLAMAKPLLAIYHEQSPVVDFLNRVGGASSITISPEDDCAALAEKINRVWLIGEAYAEPRPLDQNRFSTYSAKTQAGKLASLFSGIIG